MIKGAESVSARLPTQLAIRLFVLQTAKMNVYTDDHSGISACQRDLNVSITDLVSAEDDVNLRVSTGLLAAIHEGRRRRR